MIHNYFLYFIVSTEIYSIGNANRKRERQNFTVNKNHTVVSIHAENMAKKFIVCVFQCSVVFFYH